MAKLQGGLVKFPLCFNNKGPFSGFHSYTGTSCWGKCLQHHKFEMAYYKSRVTSILEF
jgi:hypothetical protein